MKDPKPDGNTHMNAPQRRLKEDHGHCATSQHIWPKWPLELAIAQIFAKQNKSFSNDATCGSLQGTPTQGTTPCIDKKESNLLTFKVFRDDHPRLTECGNKSFTFEIFVSKIRFMDTKTWIRSWWYLYLYVLSHAWVIFSKADKCFRFLTQSKRELFEIYFCPFHHLLKSFRPVRETLSLLSDPRPITIRVSESCCLPGTSGYDDERADELCWFG